MTYLQLVNKVLKRLRLDPVSSISSNGYDALIGEFVNEAKREVEDAWNWSTLRTSITVNTLKDVYNYELTGLNERYRLLFDKNGAVGAWNVTDKTRLKGPANYHWMTQQFITNTATNTPLYFDINGESDNYPRLNVHPIPDGVYQLQFDIVNPQDDFTVGTEVLAVPHWPVILLAHAFAVSERGEDGGASFDELHAKYKAALSDAIAFDNANLSEELIAEVV